jgi:hypothetical protein
LASFRVVAHPHIVSTKSARSVDMSKNPRRVLFVSGICGGVKVFPRL